MAPPPPLARSTRGRRALGGPAALARSGRRDAGPARSPAPQASPGAWAGQGREGRGEGGSGGKEGGRKGRRRRRQIRTKPATSGCLEAVGAMARKGRSEGSAAGERRPWSCCSGPTGCSAGFVYRRVSPINHVIDGSVVLEKALLRALKTRVAGEEGFLEGSGTPAGAGAVQPGEDEAWEGPSRSRQLSQRSLWPDSAAPEEFMPRQIYPEGLQSVEGHVLEQRKKFPAG
ncbi:uncharacterized protein LOC116992027 isoform X3 [Catharus ustulatus]|uniref:uncharacterized protein LOC116992027 isoform X3 n=1 Tax=Catharus ustulatus TaxID=91951 RepID=UPI00140C34EA|nr:uncharacterized protein LOC116992027 isoform X3 [Catharus ustulatus]